jgi:hypothetical protein
VNRRVLLGAGLVLVLISGVIWFARSRSGGDAKTSAAATQKAQAGKRATGPRAPAQPATVSGKVTRKADATPVGGAVIALAWAEMGADLSSARKPTIVVTSDANGVWIAKDVPPGDYMIAATAKGLLPSSSDKLVIASGESRTGIDFVLDAGGAPVRGTVSDMLGGPIASARVSARPQTFTLSHRVEYVGLTAADGTYELTLPDGDYGIAAAHDDYTRDTQSAEVAGKPLTIDFMLIPGGAIRGQVIARDTGKPVPGAMVKVAVGREQFGQNDITAVADDDGQFAARGLSSGNASLTARGRGYASSQPTSVQLGIGESVEGIVVLVDGAFSISGRVINKSTKEGIAGARLGVFSMGSGSEGEALEPSDADGNFEIPGVRPGSYMLFAGAENYMLEIGKTIEVVDRDITGVIVEMGAGVTLTGRVDPAAIATVALELEGQFSIATIFENIKAAMCRGDSDATGVFTLRNAPPGKFKLAAQTKDGRKGNISITVASVDQSGLVIPITPRASIAGRVVDTNGKPVAGVEVIADDQDEKKKSAMSFSFDGRGSEATGADGTFKIVGLDAGTYEVRTRTRGDWSTYVTLNKKDDKKVLVELAEGQAKTGVTVTVEARNGVIRGVVMGADRKPAADSWVIARTEPDKDMAKAMMIADGMESKLSFMFESEPVLTNAEGRFTISKLKKGKYTLIAEGPRGNSRGEKAGVDTGDSTTIQLAQLGTLALTVTRKSKPVTKYDVSCESTADEVERHVEAADGAYTLERLAPGDYKCKVRAEAGTAEGKVTVPPGDAKLALELVGWGSLTGVVVSILNDKPVPGILVIAGAESNPGAMLDTMSGGGLKTDANGRFVAEKVAVGKGRLILLPPELGTMKSIESHEYVAKDGERVDMGTIKIVPPRTGEAGTYGLAIEPFDLSPDAGVAGNEWLTVTNVKEGGPAALAGIVAGDKITALDGRSIKELTPIPATKLLESGSVGVGQTVKVTLQRGPSMTLTAIKW